MLGVCCLDGETRLSSVISRKMDEGHHCLLLPRQRRPCVVQPGVVSITRGITEGPADFCLCNVDSRVSQLKYLQLCMRNFLECLTSSGIFLIGTIASTNSKDQPSAQVQ